MAGHCKATVAFTEDAAQTAKFLEVAASLPLLTTIVQWSGELPPNATAAAGPAPPTVLNWAAFLALAAKVPAADLASRAGLVKPGHCASLIYTSGTTGTPKVLLISCMNIATLKSDIKMRVWHQAVMVSHDNLTWTSAAVLGHIAETGLGCGGEEHIVSYLPLSHIAAQLLDLVVPMAVTAGANCKGASCTVHFAGADALRGSLGNTLRDVRPTLFLGVPRVWEKISEKLLEIAATVKGPKKALSTWAKKQGAAKVAASELMDADTAAAAAALATDVDAAAASEALAAQGSPLGFRVAQGLVLSKIHAALGLERCKILGTAAAPMASSTWRYFASLNLPIMDFYGMSECTGPQTVAVPSAFRSGFCGPSMAGCELRLEHVAGRDGEGEGEVLYRGRHVMMGYLDDPVKTREALEARGGWLRSGDVGRLEGCAGMLKITGRVKELLITAGGENVAPVPIEDALRRLLGPAVANVMVVGDRKKFLALIVTPVLEPEGDGFTSRLAGASRAVDAAVADVQGARASAAWVGLIRGAVEAYNKDPKLCVSRAQKIVSFTLLPSDFSIAGDELTPTHKLKRSVVLKKYEALISEELYGAATMAKASKSGFDLAKMADP